MNIISDREKYIEIISKISRKSLNLISDEVTNSVQSEDPAQQIYVVAHIIGLLTANILCILEGFGETYAIEGLTKDLIKEWIYKIVEENLSLKR